MKAIINSYYLNFVKKLETGHISRYLSRSPTKTGSALDIGCGCGEWCAKLARMGFKVSGIDPDADELAAARALTGPWARRLNFLNPMPERLPFKENEFDLIISVCAIEHFTEFRQALSEMQRVMKDKGTLILTADSFSYQDVGKKLDQKHRKMYHVKNHFTVPELSAELKQHGFRVEESTYFINSKLSAWFFRQLLRFPIMSLALFPIAYPVSRLSDRFFSDISRGQLIALRATREMLKKTR